MREFRKASSNKSGSSVEDRPDGEESGLREVNEKRIAIVNSRTNKGIDYFSHGGRGHRFKNGSKAPE